MKNKKDNTLKKEKKSVGRPKIISDDVVGKLEQAFGIGCNVSQACIHANISRDTFYNFIKKNKKFSDRFKLLQQKPILQAKLTIYKNLEDPKIASWYLERFREPIENIDTKETIDNLSLDELSEIYMKKLMYEAIKNPNNKTASENMLKLLSISKEK